MTTHLGHCRSTNITKSHSQPYSTEPAVLLYQHSHSVQAYRKVYEAHCLHYLSITPLPLCLPKSEEDPDYRTPSMRVFMLGGRHLLKDQKQARASHLPCNLPSN